ncbi:MAG: hypothetical protein CL910_03255 [Deltaproteobacteria bacterium]|nr:hypothetical protein [Deltaproteobacteria bacterium]
MSTSLLAEIPEHTLADLHPKAIGDSDSVRQLLTRLRDERVPLRRGMNRQIEPEMAVVERVDDSHIVLAAKSFETRDPRQNVYARFALDGREYFFSAPEREDLDGGRIRARIPAAIYEFERRDHARAAPLPERGDPTKVRLAFGSAEVEGTIEDLCPSGLAVRVRTDGVVAQGPLRVRYLNGSATAPDKPAWIRNSVHEGGGWTRLGIGLDSTAEGLPVERAQAIPVGGPLARARSVLGIAGRAALLPSARLLGRTSSRFAEVVRYNNRAGQEIVGLMDSWGRGRPVSVVIPPAWGRTKETLLPLARTLVATFRRSGTAVEVLRFDGVNRRGESYKAPGCQVPGREQHGFTFSQGVEDIRAALDFLYSRRGREPAAAALVTFSAASIDGRRAVAEDCGQRIGAWISVVGSADLQDLMRTVSGGVDYLGGCARGLEFGLQEILGVEVDIDRAGHDSLDARIGFVEDSRRDFERITTPVTWYHGRFDAWMDLDRVRDVMAQGDTSKRRLVEIPTGHQLKSSREALQVFQAISCEIGRLTTGKEVGPALPSFSAMEKQQRHERGRLSPGETDLRRFWHDYLVGPNETLGIEMMTMGSHYRALMDKQMQALSIQPGQTVLDVGSGVSAFPERLLSRSTGLHDLRIVELDLVRAGLVRGREKLGSPCGISADFVESDLSAMGVPLKAAAVDRILASLLLSYVDDPISLMAEFHRVLRPGGVLVLSSLKLDADISMIYTAGAAEIRERGIAEFGDRAPFVESAMRSFLNDAARLIDLEEQGRFRFWEPQELVRLVRTAGFKNSACSEVFGAPPQALMVRATR